MDQIHMNIAVTEKVPGPFVNLINHSCELYPGSYFPHTIQINSTKYHPKDTTLAGLVQEASDLLYQIWAGCAKYCRL